MVSRYHWVLEQYQGKIKLKRRYAPTKFGDQFYHTSVDGHRLAIKRARQGLDCDEQLPIAAYRQREQIRSLERGFFD